MIIRKQFKFKNKHIVRNCTSVRCKENEHAHTYAVEIFLTAKGLDNGQMILDFGLFKTNIKDIISTFDNSYSLWNLDRPDFVDYVKANNTRWIELPVSPSAESLSVILFYLVDKVIKNTVFNNGERTPSLQAVRVHETTSGYAESHREDLEFFEPYNLTNIVISDDIKSKWKNPNLWDALVNQDPFVNPVVEQQVVPV
jgi:6-pyruvoyltetrahydropterin/6-carboxytetrahydropterin synthase